MWGILPTRERLHRNLPKIYLINLCPLCSQEDRELREDAGHALMDCKANLGSPALLMALLRTYQPDITTAQVLALDIEVDPAMELPLIWIISTSLLVVWTQRQEEAMSNAKFRAELKTRCKFLEQCNDKNVMTMTSLALEKVFS